MDELSLSINEIFIVSKVNLHKQEDLVLLCASRVVPCVALGAIRNMLFEGSQLKFSEILARVRDLNGSLVEVTGGEPLAQRNCIPF